MEKFLGHFNLYYTEPLDKPSQHIEITQDKKIIQTGGPVEGHLANWKIEEDMLLATYIDPHHGFLVLSPPEDDNYNTIYGTHMYGSGAKGEWILKRIIKGD